MTTNEPYTWSEAEKKGIQEFADGLAEVAIQKRLRYQEAVKREEATKGAEKVGKELSDMFRGL